MKKCFCRKKEYAPGNYFVLRENCKCAVPSMGHLCIILAVFNACSEECGQDAIEFYSQKNGADQEIIIDHPLTVGSPTVLAGLGLSVTNS